MSERDGRVAALEVLLYEHREDALTCYDHGGYCCVCGEHDLVGYRPHLAQALLDSPAMRDLLAEAWDEGALSGVLGRSPRANPYRQEAR